MAKEINEELDELTLEDIRKELEKNAKKSGNFLTYEEIVEAVGPLDLDEKELEDFVNYFKNKKIEVVVENDSSDDLDDIDISDIDLENFSEEESAFYDFNVTLKQNSTDNSEGFIISGAKNKNGTGLIWNNNRVVEEDTSA